MLQLTEEKLEQVKDFLYEEHDYLMGDLPALEKVLTRGIKERMKNPLISKLFKDSNRVEINVEEDKTVNEYFTMLLEENKMLMIERSNLQSRIRAYLVDLASILETNMGEFSIAVAGVDVSRKIERYENCARLFEAAELFHNKLANDKEITINIGTDKETSLKLKKGTRAMKALGLIISFVEIAGASKGNLLLLQSSFRNVDIALNDLKSSFKSPKKIILSIDPMDYLTVSGPNFDWTSCFRPGGDYQGSVFGLITSRNTMVAYVEGDECTYGQQGKKMFKKTWRRYVTLAEDGFLLGKEYPIKRDYVSATLISFLKDFFKEETGLDVESRSLKYVDVDVDFYNDYTDSTSVAYICHSDEVTFYVDGGLYCPVCGDCHENYKHCACESCLGYVECYHCGEHYDECSMTHDENGHLYCESCAENYLNYCESCESEVSDDDFNHNFNMCSTCMRDHTFHCEICGELELDCYDETLKDGTHVCRNCYEDADVCDECGWRVGDGDLDHFPGSDEHLCPDCFASRVEAAQLKATEMIVEKMIERDSVNGVEEDMSVLTIKKNDIANGPGVSVSVWFSGCPHKCEGCHNPETWEFGQGAPLDWNMIDEIIDALKANGVTRTLSILGGEPLIHENVSEVLELINVVTKRLPEVNIMLWTGFSYTRIRELGEKAALQNEVLDLCDVVVDGRYIKEQSGVYKYRGSKNQGIWVDGVNRAQDIDNSKVWYYGDLVL